jgi:GTP-binding protein Era
MKAAFVSIVGRPSAGKSTLLNKMCGYKVSITASVPQTTRNKIRGIVNRDEGQIVFIDTPGFHHNDRKFNIMLKDVVRSSLKEADLVLYVLDTTRKPGIEEQDLVELLKDHRDRIIIALNKVDHSHSAVEEVTAFITENLPEVRWVQTSAVTGEGLDELLAGIYSLSPEGEQMYPDDFYTDQDPEFRVSEIIREKAIVRTREEVPHALYVDIADMEVNEDTLWIRAFLTVERESQKGILVGRGGQVIKGIRQAAQKEIKGLFPYKIHLDLRVKVNPKWRKHDGVIRRLLG